MASLPHLAPTSWGLVFALSAAVLLWLVSLRNRDVSIVDIFWGLGVAGVVDIAAWLGQSGGARTSGEDHRYAAMRQKFGRKWWWLSLIQVFLLQAILIWFVPAPLVAAVLYARMPMGVLDYGGIAVAAVALMFESLADFQLAAFRADPGSQGKVMDRGLWGWSRHPNYFGEALMWWGYFAIGFGASHQWWLVLSPVLITFLLLQVSGVTLMEEKMDERRPGYADYRRRVSTFVPWPPKK